MSHTVRALVVALVLGAVGTSALIWQPWPGHAEEKKRAEEEAFDPDKPPRKERFAEDRIAPAEPAMKALPFDADRAMKYLKQLCDLGPRISGTEGMTRQQELLTKHFEAHGGRVTRQEFLAKQFSQRDKVKMTNLIVSWFPERPRRVILCSHYDTRPLAHEEPARGDWRKPFLSANDGTSGVAMFMELAHSLKDLATPVGLDLVLFDGEEYVFETTGPFGSGDKFFFGSEQFAEEYARNRRTLKYQYEAAVLFDLFAHPGARFPVEENSWQKADKLVSQFWATAKTLNVRAFEFTPGGAVQDDHLALNRVGIPAIDVIDFDGYREHWHRLTDTPDRCDGRQMADVARVATTWLQGLR